MMSDANVSRDLPRRHANDTLQVVVTTAGGFLFIKQPNRIGGPCWEFPGGSYQLNKGLSPEAAAVATLEHQVGLKLPENRATLIYADYLWNGLPPENPCAGAKLYVVVIPDVPRDEYEARRNGAFQVERFDIGTIGTPGFRFDTISYAAFGIYGALGWQAV